MLFSHFCSSSCGSLGFYYRGERQQTANIPRKPWTYRINHKQNVNFPWPSARQPPTKYLYRTAQNRRLNRISGGKVAWGTTRHSAGHFGLGGGLLLLCSHFNNTELSFVHKIHHWRRLHGARGGTCPHFYKWLGTGAPWAEQHTRNWPNCTVLTITKVAYQTTNCTCSAKKVEGHNKNFSCASRRTCAPAIKFVPPTLTHTTLKHRRRSERERLNTQDPLSAYAYATGQFREPEEDLTIHCVADCLSVVARRVGSPMTTTTNDANEYWRRQDAPQIAPYAKSIPPPKWPNQSWIWIGSIHGLDWIGLD